MDTQRWQRIAAIFDEAVEAPLHARAVLLEKLCDGDAEIRREVETLLAADASAATFDSGVDSARNLAAAEWVQGADDESVQAGERVGPWQVLRELGRGGMGVVWLVERADGQFEQRAALKLIKRGMDSEAVIARFLRERQILARLEHPHIARLLDGGIAADGRPYFAMEYIDGQPLLRYCADRNMKLEDRVSIFLDICTAVQFAHGQLVVHRDIKPSNVLVAADGSVKLLDFGIAKLLAADDANAAAATAIGHDRPLTLAYAAPEQVRGEPVTVATDIYGLGVLLYELLTARRPFDFSDAPTPDEVSRAFDAASPAAPSKRVRADAPFAPRRLRGDLDTIVLKALQREPQRRYATVDAFAGDLRRYLSGQPITARRDTAGYRIGKFVGRHRIGVAGAALSAVVLIAALGVAVWQARAKALEAKSAQEVTRFLVGLFAGSDPTHSGGAVISAQDLLDQGVRRLQSQLHDEPAVRARLLNTVATTYAALGLYDRAQPLAEQALLLRRQILAADDVELAESLDELGQILTQKADYAGAEPMLRQALSLRRARLGDADAATIDSLGNLGALEQNRGDFKAADAMFAAALLAAQRRYGEDAVETARRLDDYATNLDNMGKKPEALAAYQRALAIRESNLGANDADVATSLHNIGTYYDEAGENGEAIKFLERALAIRRQVFGAEHPLVGFTELALAGVYGTQSRFEDSEKLATDALSIFRRTLAADHPKISESLNMLAILHSMHRDFAGALPFAREAFNRFSQTLGADHPNTLTAENNLSFILLHSAQSSEAEKLQRDVLARTHEDNGQGTLAVDCDNLASTLEQEGKIDEALMYARRALELQKKTEGANSINVALTLRLLALAEEFHGDAHAAEADFRAALRMGEQLAAEHEFTAYRWQIPLADILVGAKRCAEAQPLIDQAMAELGAAGTSADQYWQLEARLLLGDCLVADHRSEEGVAMKNAARDHLRRLPAIEIDLYPTARRLLEPAARSK
ncbi:MAG: serine/threonine-protein kinase [Rudaea sp.]|nr:serine/threonine-protein kinase [Rudaea sp.]